MKRMLTLMLAALSMMAASAKDFFDGSLPTRIVEVNPTVGVGISSLLQNYGSAVSGVTDFLLSPGCKVSMGADVRFVIRRSLALGTGLHFNIHNSRYSMCMLDATHSSLSTIYAYNHFYSLSVPVFFTCRFNIGHNVMWGVDGGVYLSYGTGGNMKINGYTSGTNALGQPVATHVTYKQDYFMSERPLVNQVKRFDWGPHIASDIIFHERWNFGLVFEISAPNLANNYGVIPIRYRNVSVQVRMGYIF